ncbi:WS/DGAT/MGAT family O-acyltransferase [Mycobacterium xenopi]|uniref:Diacylglycerol O-acyltransferase n=2 Tax=Mycobacterium xenopi TaxID=1789 RepID=A0AAD1H4T0_MYCXE|nr:wax ester/triacylglycerol synthase family O-acyltransferase [Mycobacterium xenopi]MDA3639299.1 wax ester/triacylglycerol synthase family O-acyltransferase [Mycobacterium xenopi]MDA3657671.1 wax ester/triacylglycerol synthase family O-acyltransferase [Mycobacterium xenopi]ORX21587.1 diacylglycerol O-acyltransferase [Mycobacterium xenopi]SPX89173.1 Putative diacylglycerol O-acyltransferase [Mycobacterium xenopi]BBU23534.1 diacylglycerol O-acyltransferase [Mycobacterium xenopi]
MKLISPTDSMFLLGESREHPMHVGSLQLFQPPAHAGAEFVREAYEAMLGCTDVQPTFRKHPAFFGPVTNLAWAFDDDIDLEYHFRRSALASPGRVRELLELVSRLHGSLLDRHRPLWEAHLVEGLNDGRYAVYVKFHHSLLDGVSAARLMQRAFTTDPNDNEVRVPWALKPRRRHRGGPGRSPLQLLTGTMGSLAALGPSTASLARAALLQQQLTLPFQAPKTMFNVRIGGARRVAAQSWSLDRINRVKTATGVTVNDVVLAMSAGALRAYLIEQDALPDAPLVAMVPVNLRREDQGDHGGNRVGTVLCNLNTHIEDAAKRLEAINVSMCDSKAVFNQLPQVQQLALSAFMTGGLVFALIPGFVRTAPPPFNIVISNVPGAREPLYWRGARMVGNYPLSIALDGQAMNITVTTNAENLDFGLVGCRRSVPHLQRMLGHLETSLKDLERAVGA